MSVRERRVWIFSDLHIGCLSDGWDGDVWMSLAVEDLRRNVGIPDYVIMLGDISHASRPDQIRRYLAVRRASGIRTWFEMVGNHDFRAFQRGHWRRLIGRPFRYLVVDGNLVWVMVSAEQTLANGKLCAVTRDWLGRVMAANRDRNVVMCTHQLVANTVRRTDPDVYWWRVLHPLKWVEKFRKAHPIGAWIGGHEHGPPRDGTLVAMRDDVVFVNVAGLSHVYGTRASIGFIPEMRDGDRAIRVRCREHDAMRDREEFGFVIPLRFPLKLGESPRLVPFPRVR
ncbi:MAG: metallophosphoesterase [Planctomycetota bacterium]